MADSALPALVDVHIRPIALNLLSALYHWQSTTSLFEGLEDVPDDDTVIVAGRESEGFPPLTGADMRAMIRLRDALLTSVGTDTGAAGLAAMRKAYPLTLKVT